MPKSLRISIRDRRIGRLDIASGTTSKKVRNQYRESVRKLLDRNELEVIELLRRQRIHITEVDNAVRTGDYSRLRERTAFSAGTIGDAVQKHLAQLESTREPRTRIAARTFTNKLTARLTEGRALESVTKQDAQDFLNESGWGARSQRFAADTLRRVWTLAEARTNPWVIASPRKNRDGLMLPKVRKQRHAFLLPAQWTQYAKANAGTPELTLAALGALAGLRAGEISHLRVGLDADLERRVIRIQPRQGQYPWKPKTDNSVRDVPMSTELHTILSDHIGLGYAGGTYLIRHPGEDYPIVPDVLGNWFKRGMKRAGLVYGKAKSGITLHALRHTFASWLAQQDVQLLKIAKLIGDTVEVTANTYAHLTPQDLDRAIGVIDDVVRRASK
jgi:integrase